ncbi:MAG TPA: ribosome silencing factor [Steroidobacteraceae bacterium]|jgi:ribosome-associated protein|nr:ribosome silencing factor [Steroidobacteraceae bacterium]
MAKTSSARPGKRKTVKRAAGKTVAGKAAKKAGKNTAKKKVSAGRRAALKKTAVKKPAVKKAAKKKVAAAFSQPASVAAPSAPKSALLQLVETALADMKAVNVTVLDVRGLTDVADNMVIASGNSDRHVRSIADNVVMAAKKAGYRPMGVEGERDGEWALVDLQDIIVHVMLPRVREFYRLENLWDISAARREAAMNSA